VCSVERKWSKTRSGQRRLTMSSACSSEFYCTPSWTGWPYTEQGRYSDDDDSARGSSDSGDSSDSDISDYSDSTRFYYGFRYSYVTTHRSCPAVDCRPATGKLGFTHYTHNTTIATSDRRLMPSVDCVACLPDLQATRRPTFRCSAPYKCTYLLTYLLTYVSKSKCQHGVMSAYHRH